MPLFGSVAAVPSPSWAHARYLDDGMDRLAFDSGRGRVHRVGNPLLDNGDAGQVAPQSDASSSGAGSHLKAETAPLPNGTASKAEGVGFGRRGQALASAAPLVLVRDKMAEIGMLHERLSNAC